MGISFSSNTQGRGSEISVSWFPSGGASSYTLQIAGDESYRDAETLYEGTEANFSEVLGDGEYYFRVRANNDSGSSNWLPLGPVSVCVKPNPPQNISYPQESNGGNFSVDWSSVGRAESYTLERASGMSFVDRDPRIPRRRHPLWTKATSEKARTTTGSAREISCGYSLWKTGKAIVVSGPPGLCDQRQFLEHIRRAHCHLFGQAERRAGYFGYRRGRTRFRGRGRLDCGRVRIGPLRE